MSDPYILIDTKTGHVSAYDSEGDPIAESKRCLQHHTTTRKEWLYALVALCYQTGIQRLEFLKGAEIEVRNARKFFKEALEK